MNEKLLHFIWKNRYFNQLGLQTSDGKPIKIIELGNLNTNQGPDFLMGKIYLDDRIWIGNIELHVKASDWNSHGHENDRNYDNVILHVVWINDQTDSNIPLLELFHFVPSVLIDRYAMWMNNTHEIPCYKSLKDPAICLNKSWLDDLLIKRMRKKGEDIFKKVVLYKYDWEEIFWHELAKAFGYKVNTFAFEQVAKIIPWKILLKHKNSIHQLEAILMGQANLLNQDLKDKYAQMLFKEYCFLKSKYSLKEVFEKMYFLRMRPRNFPTIRLAQLAALIAKNGQLFVNVIRSKSIEELKSILSITANDYWNDHYRFDIPAPFIKKTMGSHMIDTIIINVFMPFLYAYEQVNHHQIPFFSKLEWLKTLLPEKNLEISCFFQTIIHPKNAWETQALLELKVEYCNQRKCLECIWGKQLLPRSNVHIKAS